jgi:hypothetical protein
MYQEQSKATIPQKWYFKKSFYVFLSRKKMEKNKFQIELGKSIDKIRAEKN